MYNRIEITNKKQFADGKANNLIKLISEDLGIKIDGVKVVYAYNFLGDFTDEELTRLQKQLFCDAVYQESATGFYYLMASDYDYAIEVAYKTGVTDNVGKTVAKGINNILGKKMGDGDVKSSMLYLFKGNLDENKAALIADKALCNKLIEQYHIFNKDQNEDFFIDYKFTFEGNGQNAAYKTYCLEVSDDELMHISDSGVLSLNIEEMHTIRDYFRRDDVKAARKAKGLPTDPTDIELEMFAQTWSEHCKHKIFSADIDYTDADGKQKEIHSLFKTFIRDSANTIKAKRDDLLSLFVDNSGVVKFNDDYAYCVKVETHNSPSALDPYGGAMTGIVGVNRDIIGTGMGAYPIFNTDVFCFGSPYTKEENVPEGLLHPRRIFRGVHRGIKDGGNESGIPTVNGSITFDDSFLGKPLVFCGTGGILPIKLADGRLAYEKYLKPGDLIVMTGGRIGKDGIHGATFSSVQLSESSPTSAVQIGDPITQKKMIDFLIEARDRGLYNGITDNGAGGLSSSIGEMAEFTNGAILHLEKCPLKYSGLQPWEILLSEAQERMSVAVPADKIDEFLALSAKRDVESTVIGTFTDNGKFECYYKEEIICSLDMDVLHTAPKMVLKAKWQESPAAKRVAIDDKDIAKSIKDIFGRPNVASKESWVRQYDHEVGGRTVVKPFMGSRNDGPADGAVMKVFPDSNDGLVITHGIVPRYSRIDSYNMAANAIDEAYRQAVMLGADPDLVVGLDNFCWADPVESKYTPDGQYKLAQLVRACQAVADTTIAYGAPCISGKDSMKNDYMRNGKKISILQTLLFTAVGKTHDITKAVTHYFKNDGDIIYLIGATKPELGGSEYCDMKHIDGGLPPVVDTKTNLANYKNYYKSLCGSLINSAHDLSDGGLAVAITEAAFSSDFGFDADITALTQTADKMSAAEALFSESAGRILVTVSPANEKKFLDTMGSSNVTRLGTTAKSDKGTIKCGGEKIEIGLDEVKDVWKKGLEF